MIQEKEVIRAFLVGCPRSGTTLTQSMLGAHTKIFTLPESHFFRRTFRGKKAFVLRGFQSSAHLRLWLNQVGLQEYLDRVPKFAYARQPVIDAFVGILDELTLRNDRVCWLEKTPGHVFVVEQIENTVSSPLFIHLIRDGRAVVASLMDVKARFPGKRIWSRPLSYFVSLWNEAISESARWVGRQNHFFLSYESLVADPKRELESACKFLSLDFEENMLEEYRQVGAQLSRNVWTQNVVNPIQKIGLSKFYSVLDDEEREYVEKHLIDLPDALVRAIHHE
jgi:hypothetical protein